MLIFTYFKLIEHTHQVVIGSLTGIKTRLNQGVVACPSPRGEGLKQLICLINSGLLTSRRN